MFRLRKTLFRVSLFAFAFASALTWQMTAQALPPDECNCQKYCPMLPPGPPPEYYNATGHLDTLYTFPWHQCSWAPELGCTWCELGK